MDGGCLRGSCLSSWCWWCSPPAPTLFTWPSNSPQKLSGAQEVDDPSHGSPKTWSVPTSVDSMLDPFSSSSTGSLEELRITVHD